jgi:hypothetical protein
MTDGQNLGLLVSVPMWPCFNSRQFPALKQSAEIPLLQLTENVGITSPSIGNHPAISYSAMI